MSNLAPELPPRVANSRRSLRDRVVLPGKVIYGEGAFSIDCRIKDISETGARIIVSLGLPVPTNIVFMEVKSRAVHEAVVVRAASPEFGLRFIRTYALDSKLPQHLDYLRRLR